MSDEISSVNDLVEKKALENNPPPGTKGANSTENNDNKIDNQGGNGATDNQGADAGKLAEDRLTEFLKKHNVESIEALEERLKTPPKKEAHVELSPEEKEKEVALYKARLQTFAVETGDMKLEDFHNLETLKQKQDAEIVYDDWTKEWIDDNDEDLEELTGEEKAEKAKDAFDSQFKLNATDQKVKDRGIAKLAKLAAQKRTPLESSYNSVKEKFDSVNDVRNNYPNYDKTVRGLINENLPDKYNFFTVKDGEEDVSVDIEITAADKAEIAENIAKKVLIPENYMTYKKGEIDALKTLTKSETDSFIQNKYQEEGKKKMADTFLKRGIAKAEKGSVNPFPLNQGKGGGVEKGAPPDAKRAVLDSLEGKK